MSKTQVNEQTQRLLMEILIFWSFIGTGVCGQITFHVTQCFLCLVPPGHNVHHYLGSDVRFHFLICT